MDELMAIPVVVEAKVRCKDLKIFVVEGTFKIYKVHKIYDKTELESTTTSSHAIYTTVRMQNRVIRPWVIRPWISIHGIFSILSYYTKYPFDKTILCLS